MLNKKVKISVRFLFSILFFKSVLIFSQQQKDTTSFKMEPDSSISKNKTDKNFSTDTVSGSSEFKKLINKTISPNSSKLAADSSNIKRDINMLVPDSSTKKKVLSKIVPSGAAKLLPDSSTKKNALNKITPSGLIGLKSDTTKNKSGIRSTISGVVTKFLPDSNTRKRVLKKIMPKTHGNISIGYDYGVIPFATNASYPLGYFKAQGNVGVSMFGLPLLATFYYSDLKNVSGLNNYFRVSFDKTAYEAMLRNNGLSKVESEAKELGSLSDLKQILQQKLAFSELYKNGLPTESSLTGQLPNLKNNYTGIKTDSLVKVNVPNVSDSSLRNTVTNAVQDSLKKLSNNSSIKKSVADSIDKVTSLLHKYDSLNSKIDQFKSQLQKIDEKIKSINNKIAYFKNPQNLIEKNPYLKKFQSIMSGVKKLDIGLSYPNYSTFLVSGSTIKGINVEWEKKFYVAFTYGKTINTVMTTSNLIQNQLQTARNMYNFFDFNNVTDSRKIMAMKFGYGKKETTHLFAGFLYGLGLPSYVSPSTQNSIEKNLVLELDGRIALNKSNTLDIVYGKSALYQDGITSGDNSNAQFPFSKFRSNAGLIKYISEFKKTKTKITATGKIVDPFFNSYGVGFMRSDNIRYELKVEQDITSKIKFSASYRKDRDNLLNTFSYTTDLQTIAANLNIKLNKRFTAKISYMPVIQNITPTSTDSGLHSTHNINNITTAVITYAPKVQHVSSFFNAMYSYYQLSGTGGKNNNFQNYNINNTTVFNQHFKANFAFNYFLNNDSDSLNNSTSLFSADVSYTTNKGAMVTLGGKFAYNNVIKEQTGGILKINIPIIKHLHVEFYAEKLVLGDFYSNYNMSEIKKFPFYCYAKVILNW